VSGGVERRVSRLVGSDYPDRHGHRLHLTGRHHPGRQREGGQRQQQRPLALLHARLRPGAAKTMIRGGYACSSSDH